MNTTNCQTKQKHSTLFLIRHLSATNPRLIRQDPPLIRHSAPPSSSGSSLLGSKGPPWGDQSIGTLLNGEFDTVFRGLCETGSGLCLPRASSFLSLLLLSMSFVLMVWALLGTTCLFFCCLQRRVHDPKNPLNFRFVGGLSLPMFFSACGVS